MLSLEFLHEANHVIHRTLMELRLQLLEAQGKIEHSVKGDKTVVTELDVLVEDRLRAALHKLDPDIPFGGEESGVDMTQKTMWLTDPIDGTECFIRGLPFWTNMIALIDEGEVVMGIIYNVMLDEYYLGVKGHGATCNGHPIHVSDRPFERAAIVTTGWMTDIGLPRDFQVRLREKITAVPKLHASGMEAVSVAKGAYEGKVVVGSKGAWDFAAGCLIMQEAGARVENIDSDHYDFADLHFIAAAPSVFDDLKAFVTEQRTLHND